jgi:predicted DNA binding CopG/RHH family protein
MKKVKLDKEEKGILESVEQGEWRSVAELKSAKKRYQEAAGATLRECRVNIRFQQSDLDALKQEAIKEGMPYQTLIKSIIRKFLNGTLTRK